MTRTDLIEFLATIITKLDVERSRFDRGTPERDRLDGLRDQLDTDLRQLVRVNFADNTPEFLAAVDDLKAANGELSKTIGDLKRVAETLGNVVALVKSVDKLVKVAAPLV